MNAREVVTKALREQGNRGTMLEACWQLYAAHCKIPPGGPQWVESRRCFFAGALITFEAMMLTYDPGTEPTDADLARVTRLYEELQVHRKDVEEGRA